MKKIKAKILKGRKAQVKIARVLNEYKEKGLHSGSKRGPLVKSRKQALAIALSEARKASKKKKNMSMEHALRGIAQ